MFDDGEGFAVEAAARLLTLGYGDVKILQSGLQGWRNADYEVLRDVNAPSKAFGELVESQRDTPSLSAEEVKKLIDAHADIVIVDVRRFDEFQAMSIPTATSVPGAELLLRVGALARPGRGEGSAAQALLGRHSSHTAGKVPGRQPQPPGTSLPFWLGQR